MTPLIAVSSIRIVLSYLSENLQTYKLSLGTDFRNELSSQSS